MTTATATTTLRSHPAALRIDDRLASAMAVVAAALVALALAAIVVAGMAPGEPRTSVAGPAPTGQPSLVRPIGPAPLPAPVALPQPGAPSH
jgi:hypothetical protein